MRSFALYASCTGSQPSSCYRTCSDFNWVLFRPTFRVKSWERFSSALVNLSRFVPRFQSALVNFNRCFPRFQSVLVKFSQFQSALVYFSQCFKQITQGTNAGISDRRESGAKQRPTLVPLNDRQITHPICVRLRHLLYDFFRGCFEPFI